MEARGSFETSLRGEISNRITHLYLVLTLTEIRDSWMYLYIN